MPWSSFADSFPAPGIFRSITYFGMNSSLQSRPQSSGCQVQIGPRLGVHARLYEVSRPVIAKAVAEPDGVSHRSHV